MGTYNNKYYEPLEQMMAIRHQYMSKILRDHSGQDIYEFFKNKKILDLVNDLYVCSSDKLFKFIIFQFFFN